MLIEYCNKYNNLHNNELAYLAINLSKKERSNIMQAITVNRSLSDNMALSAIYHKHFSDHDFFTFMKDLRQTYKSEISYYFEGVEYLRQDFKDLADNSRLKIKQELIDGFPIEQRSKRLYAALKKISKLQKDPKRVINDPGHNFLEEFLKN